MMCLLYKVVGAERNDRSSGGSSEAPPEAATHLSDRSSHTLGMLDVSRNSSFSSPKHRLGAAADALCISLCMDGQ